MGDIREQNDQLGWDLPSDFCADVFCRPDLSVELIELNSYGAQMAAGSCLFHWITDYDQLYGVCNASGRSEVEFRVVRPTNEDEEALLELEGRGFRAKGKEMDTLLADVRNKLATLDGGSDAEDSSAFFEEEDQSGKGAG